MVRRYLTAALGAAVLAACGSSEGPTTNPGTATAPAQATSSETAASERVTRGGIAKILPMTDGDGDGDEAGSCSPTTVNLSNPGSNPVMHNVRAHLIYWLPSGTHFEVGGNATSDTAYEGLLQRFVTDIGSTPLFQMLSQYTDSTGAPTSVALGGTYLYTTAYPNGKGTTSNPLRDSDIQGAITSILNSSGGPGWTASTDDIFFVYTGANVQSCLSSDSSLCTFSATLPDGGTNSRYGAYHSDYTLNGASVIYANMPAAASIGYYANAAAYPNDPNADPTVTAMSHELFESITDPLLNAWRGPSGGCDEIGDKCNLNMGPAVNFDGSNLITPNGDRYVVQEEWSNAQATALGASSGCTMGVAPPSAPQCIPSSECGGSNAASVEILSLMCVTQPGAVQQKSASGWVTQTDVVQGWYGLGQWVAAQYEIGTQSAGVSTGGDPIGSGQQVRACATTNAGTTCDLPTEITVEDCCTPKTCTFEAGMCGSQSDTCGGTINCGGCATGETCEDGFCNTTCTIKSCPAGSSLVGCECVKAGCPPGTYKCGKYCC
jgi:hypothetical protein